MGVKNILAIDQGTTSSRAIIFSAEGEILATAQKEITLHYPQDGWVEQDPHDIWDDTLWACRDVMEQVDGVAVIGITNQRETTIIWDRHTGEPVYNAIVWQDRRMAGLCANLKAQGHEDMIVRKTGLLLDPYFSATKIVWILDNVEGVRARAEAGDLLFGTVDCFLLWRLSGGKSHITDATNASRTMLFNIVEQKWDEELLALFNIPVAMLPEVRDNIADFGVCDPDLLGVKIPIGGMAGDQQAALIGQSCFETGMVKATYGTGCFVLMNIGTELNKVSQNRLLTTIGYRIDGNVTYALEGSVFSAGAAVQWLRDGLKLIDDAKESEVLARTVMDNGGVYFVPALTGLGAPYWKPDARGLITGLGRDSTAAHIARATLEAQAYQTKDLMAAMQADAGGIKIRNIRADGGLVMNEFVCQFLADMLDVQIEVPEITESTAYGAAMLAGLSIGLYKDLNDVAARWQCARVYNSTIDEDKRDELYGGWKSAVEMLL